MAESTTKKVLVINAGSSSVKFVLFDMSDEQMIVDGHVERVTLPGWHLDYTIKGEHVEDQGPEALNHRQALRSTHSSIR